MTPIPSARAPYPLLILFVILATAIAGLAYRFQLAQEQAIQHEVHNQLLSIADMKLKQITAWRAEKLGEARVILNSSITLAAVQRLVSKRGSEAEKAALENWLDALCRELHWAGATLTDPLGAVVMSRGRRFGDPAHLRELAVEVAAKREVTLTDFHLDGPAPAHLGLNVPLRVEPGLPAFGALLIGLDPEDYLFPMLRGWPVPSSSAESLLVRRDGGEVVFITPLRHLSRGNDELRLPISRTDVAAVRAVIGEEGTLEARDYRGVPIFAAARSIPDTTWRLIAKIDAEEVLAPLRWRSRLMGALAISLICVAGGGVFVLWRRRELHSYRARYESELQRREAAERYDAERRRMHEELRRVIDALQTSESLFRAAFEQVAVGMNQVSLDGRFLRVNHRYCEITGYGQEELMQLGYADLTHPDDRAVDAENVRRILAGEQATASWEKRYIRKDGAVIRAAITASLLRSSSGEPLKILAVVEDITASTRAKEALRQSEERFRQVVEQAPEGIVVVMGPEIRYVNPAAADMFGAESAAAMIGTAVLDRVHPGHRASVCERNSAVLAGQSAPVDEHCYLRMDGESFTVQVSASPISYDGRPAALVFFRDMTEHKRAADEKSRLEQRLHQAQKMESVGRLAGGVAHDFNNHLTVINGYCDMLLDALAPEDPLREELGEIRAAGERAAALTQQLLAFSRKQIVEPRPLILNEVVEEYCRLVRRLIGDDIEVVAELEPALGAVMADRGQMHQILMNLAVNSRDAMPHGGKIVVATSNVEIEPSDSGAPEGKSGPHVMLTVTDTGVGMSDEILQKIFEPFFTTKPLGVGTGLGLATVYGIVEQSGGFIRVSSRPGEGTTFRIHLPRIEQIPEAPDSRLSAPARLPGSETVLVVEDQDDVRKLALGILKKSGYRLLEAANGPEAILVAGAFPESIDLLVTDVIMPGMTGRELATRLQSVRPKLKVLYTSGYSAEVIAHEGVLDGGVSYLAKPFVPADLAAKVRGVLSA
jgi:two-component system cell cycle sensor histidine kinase/response regulator CckA